MCSTEGILKVVVVAGKDDDGRSGRFELDNDYVHAHYQPPHHQQQQQQTPNHHLKTEIAGRTSGDENTASATSNTPKPPNTCSSLPTAGMMVGDDDRRALISSMSESIDESGAGYQQYNDGYDAEGPYRRTVMSAAAAAASDKRDELVTNEKEKLLMLDIPNDFTAPNQTTNEKRGGKNDVGIEYLHSTHPKQDANRGEKRVSVQFYDAKQKSSQVLKRQRAELAGDASESTDSEEQMNDEEEGEGESANDADGTGDGDREKLKTKKNKKRKVMKKEVKMSATLKPESIVFWESVSALRRSMYGIAAWLIGWNLIAFLGNRSADGWRFLPVCLFGFGLIVAGWYAHKVSKRRRYCGLLTLIPIGVIQLALAFTLIKYQLCIASNDGREMHPNDAFEHGVGYVAAKYARHIKPPMVFAIGNLILLLFTLHAGVATIRLVVFRLGTLLDEFASSLGMLDPSVDDESGDDKENGGRKGSTAAATADYERCLTNKVGDLEANRDDGRRPNPVTDEWVIDTLRKTGFI